MSNRAICPVSFDLEDAHEKALHEFAKMKGKFSPYIKRLIWMDMIGRQATISAAAPKHGDDDDRDSVAGLV